MANKQKLEAQIAELIQEKITKEGVLRAMELFSNSSEIISHLLQNDCVLFNRPFLSSKDSRTYDLIGMLADEQVAREFGLSESWVSADFRPLLNWIGQLDEEESEYANTLVNETDKLGFVVNREWAEYLANAGVSILVNFATAGLEEEGPYIATYLNIGNLIVLI